MGKRSDFKRRERDFYPTPYEAVFPLLPHLAPKTKFIEPCAGERDLVRHLTEHGHECVSASDIADRPGIDARHLTDGDGADVFITNPPWGRSILHPIIVNLSNTLPTWLLFDADWMHTKQAVTYLERCLKIVSVARVKWMGPDSPHTGKDNCCWFLFDRNHPEPPMTQFFGKPWNI